VRADISSSNNASPDLSEEWGIPHLLIEEKLYPTSPKQEDKQDVSQDYRL